MPYNLLANQSMCYIGYKNKPCNKRQKWPFCLVCLSTADICNNSYWTGWLEENFQYLFTGLIFSAALRNVICMWKWRPISGPLCILWIIILVSWVWRGFIHLIQENGEKFFSFLKVYPGSIPYFWVVDLQLIDTILYVPWYVIYVNTTYIQFRACFFLLCE